MDETSVVYEFALFYVKSDDAFPEDIFFLIPLWDSLSMCMAAC